MYSLRVRFWPRKRRGTNALCDLFGCLEDRVREVWFERLLGFLLGVSWAMALVGGLYAALIFSALGWVISLVAFLFGSIFGFFFVILFEFIHRSLQNKQRELALLESIVDSLQRASSSKRDEDEKLSNH